MPSWHFLLLPISVLFYGLVWLRAKLYQLGIKKITHFKIPIVVVGNISVGGSGKTPLTIALAQYFTEQGLRVGVVLRGYKSGYKSGNLLVNHHTSTHLSGDEPKVIAQATNAVVMVNKNRVLAVKGVTELGVDIVISDDGLQHYALGRRVEIAVIDSMRGIGNGYLMPAGILREPVSRLSRVDFIINHKRTGGQALANAKLAGYLVQKNTYTMLLKPLNLVNIKTKEMVKIEDFLAHYPKVYAVAGIAQPQSFFAQLQYLGFEVISQAFADHHLFCKSDFTDKSNYPILMTHKDCVKCEGFAVQNMWYLAVKADLPARFFEDLSHRL